MTVIRIISIILAYICNVYSYPIISDKNKSICTDCFSVPIQCTAKDINITNFTEHIHYCNKCNINGQQLVQLYCYYCKEVIPCPIDTGCFNCNNCTGIYISTA